MSAPGVKMDAVTVPGFKIRLTHGPSTVGLITEAPKDNGGTGQSFSPTDLVGAALLSCALTTMALVAAREGVPWGEASGEVQKRMTPPPRRIAELAVKIRMPPELPREERARFEEVARTCPVARSLGADVQHPMVFEYE
jgi:putative redox protein